MSVYFLYYLFALLLILAELLFSWPGGNSAEQPDRETVTGGLRLGVNIRTGLSPDFLPAKSTLWFCFGWRSMLTSPPLKELFMQYMRVVYLCAPPFSFFHLKEWRSFHQHRFLLLKKGLFSTEQYFWTQQKNPCWVTPSFRQIFEMMHWFLIAVLQTSNASVPAWQGSSGPFISVHFLQSTKITEMFVSSWYVTAWPRTL